ncbi:MAG TPA: ribbon-helix-helix protein, CopG family [Nocardioidaceae bacterium]|nr:ribbon-helix-helix protein, CopG family [Nocardioidaceae bacterium]
MSIQIAVRLPDDVVQHLDELVRAGAGSRAAVIETALERHFQRLLAEHDAKIYAETGDYDDLAGLGKLNYVADLD